MKTIFFFTFALIAALAQAQTITSVTASPSAVVGGNGSELIVRLSAPVASNVTINLSSNKPSVTVLSTTTVDAGSDYATVDITTSGVNAATTATLTASLGGAKVYGYLTVRVAALSSIVIAPGSINGGNQSSITAFLTGQAGPSGITVPVASSNAAVANLAGSLTIAPGATNGKSLINTVAVDANTNVTFTANLSGTVERGTLQVASAALLKMTLTQRSVVGGDSAGNVYAILNGTAGPSGVTVTLTSSGPVTVTVPPSIFVAAGQSEGVARVTTSPVAADVAVAVIGSIGSSGTPQSAAIFVESPLGSPWTSAGGNVSGSGYSPGSGATGVLQWALSDSVQALPVIGANASLWFPDFQGLTSASLSGQIQTTFGLGYSFESSPAVGPDGTVYGIWAPGSGGNYLIALDSNGRQKWGSGGAAAGYEPIGQCSPMVGLDGTIYIGATADGKNEEIVALNPDKTTKWLSTVPSIPSFVTHYIGMTLAPDGSIYYLEKIGSDHGHGCYLVSVDPANGEVNWAQQVSDKPGPYMLAVGPTGTLYVVNDYGDGASSVSTISAFTTLGTQLWSYHADEGALVTGLAIGLDGTIYFTYYQYYSGNASGGCFSALNPTGTFKWNFQTNDALGNPAVDADGVVYAWSQQDGNVYAVNHDGTLKWNLNLGTSGYPGLVPNAPIIGADGTIYVCVNVGLGSSPPPAIYAIH